MFERTKAKIRLHRICKALGVEPYPERGKRDYKDGYNCRVFIMDETGRRT